MAAVTLKRLWKNEYFQTAIMIILTVVIVSGLWYGCQRVLNTQYPALAVVSTSMLPTLNVGDVIIVQGLPAAQIHANYTTGDVVVYRLPYNPDKRIVHRAVKKESRADGYWITAQGDNNVGPDPPFHEDYLIGKVIARIPYVGNFDLFVNAPGNFYFFIILIIILVIVILISLPFKGTEEEKNSIKEKPHERRKLFGKLDIEIVYLLILNSLIIVFLVFSLSGIYTFWQPGADPPQYVSIRGMYSDLQYHESFEKNVFLSQGLFTYKIDCLVDGTTRPGVPTVSWMQTSILILFLLNSWVLINFVKSRRSWKKELDLSLYKQDTDPKICNSNHA